MSDSWSKPERAGSTCRLSRVARVMHTVHDRYLKEIEWAHTIEAGDVYSILVLVRSSLVMGVYSAARTEEMLCDLGVEAVAGQRLLALQDLDPTHFG
jgi:hypothetical protein